VKSNRDGPTIRPLTLLAIELEEPRSHCPTSDVLCRLVGTVGTVPAARKWPERKQASGRIRLGQVCAGESGISENAERQPRTSQVVLDPTETCSASQYTPFKQWSLIRSDRTPVRSAIPAKPHQRLLVCHRARLTSDGAGSDDPEPWPAKDASSQLVHPTLSKKSTRVPRDGRPLRGRRDLLLHGSASLRSAPLSARPALFTPDRRFEDQPLAPVLPLGGPDAQVSPTFGPKLLSTPPRERQRFPQHRTPSTSKRPSSGRSDSRVLPPCESSRHLSPSAAVFGGLLALG